MKKLIVALIILMPYLSLAEKPCRDASRCYEGNKNCCPGVIPKPSKFSPKKEEPEAPVSKQPPQKPVKERPNGDLVL